MTKEEILAMEAGEQLDRRVAEEVMGEPKPSRWTPRNALELQLVGNPAMSKGENWLCLCKYEEGDIPLWHPLPFSTDISPAWLVVEKLEKQGYYIEVTRNILGERGIKFTLLGVYLGVGVGHEVLVQAECPIKRIRDAPEAICKAALLAKLAA